MIPLLVSFKWIHLLIIAAVALLTVNKRIVKDRKTKQIPAPEWARAFWHIVPVELRDSLTYEDWQSIKRIVPFKMPLFCSTEELESFKGNVYLSCTTSPDRIKMLPITLNCLDTSMVKEIQLNLPYKFGRNQKTYDNIPEYVLQYPKLKIYWHDVDDGPLMKILNTIERVQTEDPDAICIAIDDDMCYPAMHIKSLVSAHIATQAKAVVGGKGANVERYFTTGHQSSQVKSFLALWPASVPHEQPLPGLDERNLMEGFGAIAYRAKHLHPARLRELSKASNKCFTSDDLTLNYSMQERGITRFVINQFDIKGFSYGNQDDALHIMQSHHSTYPVCVDSIKAK